MTKQSFPIPEGCKAVTVEQVGNQIITTFEPRFKRGDVLICYDEKTNNNIGRFVFIFKDIVPDNMSNGICSYVHLSLNRLRLYYEDRLASNWDVLRYATPEEAQRLWDALAKKGKRWNPETMQVDEIKNELVVVVASEKLEAGDLVYIQDGKAYKIDPVTVNVIYGI